MSYILSIVVPTKDRYEYLIQLIDLIKGFNTDEIELVVQDNTKDNSEIVEHIKQLNYPHLKYFHTPEQISVAYNSDLAILNSTGKYVCFIGDDDGVSAHIVSAVKWMEKMDIDVLKTASVSYFWPSFSFSRIANFSAALIMNLYDKSYKQIDAKEQLKKSLRKGGIEVRFLPKVYHGIAKRSTLDKVYKLGGTFFPGPSPDMANGVAMCFVADNFVFLNFPIIIIGNSVRSGGDSRKHKKQCAPISDIPFLPKDTVKNWEINIPKIWSAETIMPESACKSLRYMGKENYINKYFNVEQMLAYFIIGHSDLRKLTYEIPSNKIKLNYYMFQNLTIKIFRAIYNKIIYKVFLVIYSGFVDSRGILSIKNYSSVTNNIESINNANKFIVEQESSFDPK